MDKSFGAKCGHVKRRLKRNEPLTCKVLEFSLEVLSPSPGGSPHELNEEISRKLKVGQPLSAYEAHWFVDVILVHMRF